ncbi:hypothetical protein NQ317_010319 [Molorchus minor]|uniref:Uncharacterized protein n=1 Tax=Molorchus minor TaxID=1323400 RepID=A0ABQ9IYY6_9CUCU|nr:hypothetical protein NQ317_010319 [Molorchus minor]
MLKIRALNRESSSDEDVPVIRKEAQEEIALELYNKALRLQTQENYSEAEEILLKLTNENIPLLENNGGLPKSMSTLKYSCFMNLGNIYIKGNKVNKALEKYLEGLECSESHWPCLDQLISVLFAINDTIACLITQKGLVLRRQIYRENPATREYYQLYNPDIWEPPLDIPIDDEDEKKYLKETQILCDRVIEIEKSYGPKPLQTIPLPKPLEEYTWLSLAKTVTYLHQYITDNEMSHFTMIDINKCMSQSSEITAKSPAATETEPTFNDIGSENIEKQNEEKPIEKLWWDLMKKWRSNRLPERRFSQNSENNDGQENTPIQTDNDEEQNLDQDMEETNENLESKAERGRPRVSKRKRDLLSDLQIWGWHSKRKQSKKAKEKDFTVEDALNRIIPKTLLHNRIDPEKYHQMEDSMDMMDLYNLYVTDQNVNYLSPIHSPKSVNYEPYFGTDRESEDVLEFLDKETYILRCSGPHKKNWCLLCQSYGIINGQGN